MQELDKKRTIEALLIATDEPLPLSKIIDITALSKEDIVDCINILNQEYHSSNRAFEIKEVAGGYQIYTLPEFSPWVGELHEKKSKLTRAALETLAVVAYHQPITRPEVEKVRGVDSTWILDVLLQKGLIRTSGRLPVPGRPIRYVTTKEFLRYFGIKDLSELPREEDFGEETTPLVQPESVNTNLDDDEPATPDHGRKEEDDLDPDTPPIS